MIVRELPDGTALVIAQEAHADVAAQFAAHWGNARFAKLAPYEAMVFGTIYHDSGHREMEADLPIDVEKGFPYTFRGAPPEVRHREADPANVKWIESRDAYSSLIVQMHHNGLRKGRYNTVRSAYADQAAPAEPAAMGPGLDAALADLEDWQRGLVQRLGLNQPDAASALWHNYRALQVFDLLSLHFCCDGFTGGQMREVTLRQVPIRYGSDQVTDICLKGASDDIVGMTPYPFDVPELEIAVTARRVSPAIDEAGARQAYHKGPRQLLSWTITG